MEPLLLAIEEEVVECLLGGITWPAWPLDRLLGFKTDDLVGLVSGMVRDKALGDPESTESLVRCVL